MVEQLDEFLVFGGITTFGTMEQRVMGTFQMLDQNHDHQISRDEFFQFLKISNEMNTERMTDEGIEIIVDAVMKRIDKDRVCYIPFFTILL